MLKIETKFKKVKLPEINTYLKLFLIWYLFIFLSTEFLSFFNAISKISILFFTYGFVIFLVYFFRSSLQLPLRVSISSRSDFVIIALLLLTFIQGFISAPSTTDAMTYHIPRVMYWLQEQTVSQDSIRNSHDFMPPFAEYILLHLYSYTGDDKLLFLSQWLAYALSIFASSVIVSQLGASQRVKELTRLFVSLIPIAVLQSVSTQVDMVSAALVVITLHIVLVFLERPNYANAFYLAFALGLGVQIKAPFVLSAVIPLILLLTLLVKQFKKTLLLGGFIVLIFFLVQLRFFSQNIFLYGNILGQNLSGEGNTYANERFDPPAIASNLIRNSFNQIPIPIFSSDVQRGLEILHNLIGIDINDPKTTYLDHKFHVGSLLYPQEDIAGNTIHLILIIITGLILISISISLISVKDSKNINLLRLLYLGLLIYYVVFAVIIKWEPYHNRLQIAFFVVGTLIGVYLLSVYKYGRYFLNIGLFLSIPLAFALILLNISRPYISYSLFYESIKQFSLPLSSIPESFFIKPREKQYFNARYYWYEPYENIAVVLAETEDIKRINLKLMDEFEYPLWVLLKERKAQFLVVQEHEKDENTILVTTSEKPIHLTSYQTQCFKTSVEYGYACVSIKLKEL